MSPVTFVINADDLGGSSAINRSIFELMTEGLVTSASVMANGPAFKEAAAECGKFARASYGVHLNLTQYRPLTQSRDLAPLLDDSGEFRSGAVYGVRWTRALLRAVIEEWSAQVQSVQDAGIPISHLDSHEHVHTVPALFPALKQVQRRFGVRRVRSTMSIYDASTRPGYLLRSKKAVWRGALKSVFRTRTTDEFASLLGFARAVAEGAYSPKRQPSVIELMVHPSGLPTSEEEVGVLRSPWMSELPFSSRLGSYWEL